MKRALLTFVIGLLCAAPVTAGTITFEGIVGPGERLFANTGERPSPQVISDGVENFVFTLISGNWSFEDSAYSGAPPRNGTDTMSVDGFQYSTITIQKQGGGSFDLNSVDLAVWTTTPATMVRVSSGALSQDFSPGTTFGTFLFPAGWAGLTSVSLTNVGGANAWTLDNVVLNTSTVPEPASLLLFGTGLVGLRSWRKRRQ